MWLSQNGFFVLLIVAFVAMHLFGHGHGGHGGHGGRGARPNRGNAEGAHEHGDDAAPSSSRAPHDHGED